MSHGPERKIQERVKEYGQERGWLWFKRSTLGPWGTNGQPDGEFSRHPREIFFIEFKAPGKTSTPLQLERQRELRERGFPVYECDNVDEGKEIVDFHTEEGTACQLTPGRTQRLQKPRNVKSSRRSKHK